jgi:hypothetical protein
LNQRPLGYEGKTAHNPVPIGTIKPNEILNNPPALLCRFVWFFLSFAHRTRTGLRTIFCTALCDSRHFIAKRSSCKRDAPCSCVDPDKGRLASNAAPKGRHRCLWASDTSLVSDVCQPRVLLVITPVVIRVVSIQNTNALSVDGPTNRALNKDSQGEKNDVLHKRYS